MALEKGQQILVDDLEILLDEAKSGEFGDFSNNKYPTPKITLAEKLLELRQNVIDGKYD
jgi:hypothetical protein